MAKHESSIEDFFDAYTDPTTSCMDFDRLKRSVLKVHSMPTVLDNPIIVRHSEARYLLTDMLAITSIWDPVLDVRVIALSKSFLDALYKHFPDMFIVSKVTLIPTLLESELKTTVEKHMLAFALRNFKRQSTVLGIDVSATEDMKSLLRRAKEIPEVVHMEVIWKGIVEMLVGLLVVRHLEKFASRE